MKKAVVYLAFGCTFILCGASAGPGGNALPLDASALALDTRIESPAANNNVRSVAAKQPGDTIRFQLFAPDDAGERINGWTVELSLPGRTFDSYFGSVAGTAWTGAALIVSEESGRPSLSMLSVSAVAVPGTGYLGEITLTVSRALPSDATLIVRSASLGNVGGQWQLDVSGAVISFDLAACPGDVDNSGRVDFADFLLFVAAFGASAGAPEYDARMDLSSDSVIDFADFLLFVPVFGTTCDVPPPSNGGGGTVPDREILEALYSATNGTNWSQRTNWLSDRPLGDWHGVTVDTDQRVTRLRLPENGLRGEMPSELGNLANLQWLELNANGLTGEITSSLGDLSNLELLYLHENRLTGEIPSSLGNLANLRWLYLHTNRLSEEIPSSLGDLGSLRFLDVHDNGLHGEVPESLGNLSSLQTLNLSENPLTGALPVTLIGLTNLTNLYLDDTELCAPTDAAFQAWLQGIANKRGVVDCGAGGTMDREALVALYNATDGPHWTNKTNWLSARPLGVWHGVTVNDSGRVAELRLASNQLSGQIPEELGNLPKLKRLYLNNNPDLSGPLPGSMTGLNSLEALNLSGTRLCAPTSAAYRTWLKGIADTAGVISCGVSDREMLVALYNATDGPNWANKTNWLSDRHLGQWHGVTVDGIGRVTRLNLYNNRMSGEIPAELGNLTSLEWLYLNNNQLSNQIPAELGSLAKLRHLYLHANRFSGQIPAALGRLASLERLFLSNNQLSEGVPAELGNLTNLVWLYLNNNAPLSGPLPSSMTGLNSLRVLSLSGTQLCAPADAAFQAWLKGIANTTGVTNCDADGAADRDELLALYNATDGSNWTNKTNWLSDRPLGEWHGVTTDDNGRVTRLWLENNQLSGAMPAALGNLANLDTLNLSRNRLSGQIPDQLGSLANLRNLLLYENRLSGAIPPALGSLANLRNLFLGENQLIGAIPAELWRLTNLVQLQLSNNQLNGTIPTALGSLTRLQRLYLYNNAGLTGPLPASMTALSSLNRLDLSGTQLCAPPDAAFQAWLEGIATRIGVVNCVVATEDYDQDDDGLIEVASLVQLNAMRWDLDGNGAADGPTNATAYDTAFPDAVAGMGCPSAACTGYELVADLDFDTNNSSGADAGDDYWNNGRGWAPIGSGDGGSHAFMFRATFEGNSHVISGLYINHPGERHVGFFGYLVEDAEIRNLALEDVSVTSGGRSVGGLAGSVTGRSAIISDSHVTGSVSGTLAVGGLAGYILGTIRYSYFSGSVTGTGGNIGGLVGESAGNIKTSVAAGAVTGTGAGIGGLVGRNDGGISVSYATCSVSATDGGSQAGGLVGSNYGAVSASYAIGPVSGRHSGGLIGTNWKTVTASYWDTRISGQSTSAGGEGKTTSELQSPTGYTGIYATWNLDLDGDGAPDDPWHFGRSSQYPVLKRTDAPAIPPPVVTQPLDRAALVALYNATDGANWTNKTNWLSDKPLGEWHGVTTNDGGRVTNLHININKLSGRIPMELGNLQNLERLYLHGNQLSGQIPSQLGSLANLRILSLSSNQLSGEIPSELGNLANLVQLHLNKNQLSGRIPVDLASLPNLRNLYLQSNQLSGEIPSELGNLANLEQLNLPNNQLSGTIPAALGSLVNLEGLWLHNNQLSGQIPSELGNPANLLELNLFNNQLSGQIPSELGNLANLEYLNLSRNHLNGQIPSALGSLRNLAEMHLDNNPNLSGHLPGSLMGLGSLASLSLLGTQLCAPSDAAFQAWLGGIATRTGVVNCPADYDQDDDGLIEVASLVRLNAVRRDLNGDGDADVSTNTTAYDAAFPDAVAGMGCPTAGCTGYELVANLDFDTNKSGGADPGDEYWNNGQGWTPIGGSYGATFEGNSHVISGLHINYTGRNSNGLFYTLGSDVEIRNLGLRDVSINGRSNFIGGLAGYNSGNISASYATGTVTANFTNFIGGLVGRNYGNIIASYAFVSVTGGRSNFTGGLVARNSGTVSASYAAGAVSGTGGGLVARNDGTITASYWDTQTSGQSTSAGGEGKTTRELQSPTGYTGIYADWNLDLDGDGAPDDPWDFGTSTQYPKLK